MKKIIIKLGVLTFAVAIFCNLFLSIQEEDIYKNFTTLSSLTKANAQTQEDDPCDGFVIPPGHGCQNGVLFVKEALVMVSCEKKKDCWLWIAKEVGMEGICQTNSGGVLCRPIACDAPEPECF